MYYKNNTALFMWINNIGYAFISTLGSLDFAHFALFHALH